MLFQNVGRVPAFLSNNSNLAVKEGTEEPLFRAQNRCIGVQVRKVYDAVSADYA